MVDKQKSLGQYFTKHTGLRNYIFNRVENVGAKLLEPSFGAGHILMNFLETNENHPMVCFEIDKTIEPEVVFNNNQTVIYEDFLSYEFDEKFKTIVGNPPYVKGKGSASNMYIKFIEKCYHLLDDGGELIFVVPSDFMRLTTTSKLIVEMCENGKFTHFLFPHKNSLFENASIDVTVFRYQKINREGVVIDPIMTYHSKTFMDTCVVQHGIPEEPRVEHTKYNVLGGIITFGDQSEEMKKIEDYFDVGVGMVSAKDEVFKVPLGNIDILQDENMTERFIYVNQFPTKNKEIDEHLKKYKQTLMDRKIRKFTEKNWFEWGAARNLKLMENNNGKDCIYVRTLSRKSEIAFLGKVQRFGGRLLCMVPKSDKTDLEKVVKELNDDTFKSNYQNDGRFKMGQRQLALSCLKESVF